MLVTINLLICFFYAVAVIGNMRQMSLSSNCLIKLLYTVSDSNLRFSQKFSLFSLVWYSLAKHTNLAVADLLQLISLYLSIMSGC